MSMPFLARYAGTCVRCDESFPPGTAVVWSPDGGEAMALAHEHCPAEPAGNASVCGDCFCVRPCFCD